MCESRSINDFLCSPRYQPPKYVILFINIYALPEKSFEEIHFVVCVLVNPADEPTNKQTDMGKNIIPLVELIKSENKGTKSREIAFTLRQHHIPRSLCVSCLFLFLNFRVLTHQMTRLCT